METQTVVPGSERGRAVTLLAATYEVSRIVVCVGVAIAVAYMFLAK